MLIVVKAVEGSSEGGSDCEDFIRCGFTTFKSPRGGGLDIGHIVDPEARGAEIGLDIGLEEERGVNGGDELSARDGELQAEQVEAFGFFLADERPDEGGIEAWFRYGQLKVARFIEGGQDDERHGIIAIIEDDVGGFARSGFSQSAQRDRRGMGLNILTEDDGITAHGARGCHRKGYLCGIFKHCQRKATEGYQNMFTLECDTSLKRRSKNSAVLPHHKIRCSAGIKINPIGKNSKKKIHFSQQSESSDLIYCLFFVSELL